MVYLAQTLEDQGGGQGRLSKLSDIPFSPPDNCYDIPQKN